MPKTQNTQRTTYQSIHWSLLKDFEPDQFLADMLTSISLTSEQRQNAAAYYLAAMHKCRGSFTTQWGFFCCFFCCLGNSIVLLHSYKGVGVPWLLTAFGSCLINRDILYHSVYTLSWKSSQLWLNKRSKNSDKKPHHRNHKMSLWSRIIQIESWSCLLQTRHPIRPSIHFTAASNCTPLIMCFFRNMASGRGSDCNGLLYRYLGR